MRGTVGYKIEVSASFAKHIILNYSGTIHGELATSSSGIVTSWAARKGIVIEGRSDERTLAMGLRVGL